ncbi:MAG TPA: hypothetical protein VFW75_07025 [Acetobacteraceae bacterium]|nr:hypothetical protein [Acetobacteraceae bacterium]
MTDGTTADTVRVATLPAPDANGYANLTDFTAVGGQVLFDYTDGSNPGHAPSLWTTDGTADGTRPVAGVDARSTDLSQPPIIDGKLVYISQAGLKTTDLTSAGTELLRPRVRGTFDPIGNVVSLGSVGIFVNYIYPGYFGYDPTPNQLWRTDGTTAGTTLVTILPDRTLSGTSNAEVTDIVAFGTKALFVHDDGSTDPRSLWVTDGIAGGTIELPGLTFPRIGSGVGAIAGSRYVFTSGEGLDATDGTAAGTTVIRQLVLGSGGFVPAELMATLGNDVVFAAGHDGMSPPGYSTGPLVDLWKTDGTAAGTSLIATLPDNSPAGTDLAGISTMSSLGSRVVFTYNDGAGDNSVWSSDGTASGTVMIEDHANANVASWATALIATPPPPSPPAPPPPSPDFFITDTSTGQSSTAASVSYSGPVSGLQSEYINVSADNLNIATNVPNAFIHSGSGNDAIMTSSGRNVLDGGPGSNFLTGSTGSDTFFVDDRVASTDIWTTVANFHAGDDATVWGLAPGDFNLGWADHQGAAGHTGLTLHATVPDKPVASLTLVGYSRADIGTGRLSVSFGIVGGDTPYMNIHANG